MRSSENVARRERAFCLRFEYEKETADPDCRTCRNRSCCIGGRSVFRQRRIFRLDEAESRTVDRNAVPLLAVLRPPAARFSDRVSNMRRPCPADTGGGFSDGMCRYADEAQARAARFGAFCQPCGNRQTWPAEKNVQS